MDFIDQLQALSTKALKIREHLQTEEATKNALIMPFIGILGYDIFDPTEVIPEFVADVGIKKGEKVDYAIVKDGKVILLYECKKCGAKLELEHASQLFRYFTVTDARVGILTDGLIYRFYTDLEAPNKMDSKPFMEFNLLDIQEPLVSELKKLSKPFFNMEEIITVAGEMKYTREIKHILAEQLSSPSDDFVRFFAAQIYSGKLTQGTRERFADITKRAINQFINERINERLKSAMARTSGMVLLEDESSKDSIADEQPTKTPEDLVLTTEEEYEAFFIVKAILREIISPERIIARDTQSYFGILLDDNNRKPICRFHFNRSQKYLGLIGENKAEERVPIETLNDIYKYADRLKRTISFYDKLPEADIIESANTNY